MPTRKSRFLLPRAGRGDGLGYIDRPLRELQPGDPPERVEAIRSASAMIDEPECLDADDWALHIDKRAKFAEEQRQKFEEASRERERRLMGFEQRLVAAQTEARRRCIDVTREVRLLQDMQARQKSVRHLEQRLGVVERKVWRDAA